MGNDNAGLFTIENGEGCVLPPPGDGGGGGGSTRHLRYRMTSSHCGRLVIFYVLYLMPSTSRETSLCSVLAGSSDAGFLALRSPEGRRKIPRLEQMTTERRCLGHGVTGQETQRLPWPSARGGSLPTPLCSGRRECRSSPSNLQRIWDGR